MGKRTAPPRVPQATPRSLVGLGGSPGRVRGRACLVFSPDDLSKVTPGCILVCSNAKVATAAIFSNVAGVVTDAGGSLSSPAIVAREMGIPSVLGTRWATSFVRDGDMLIVDGAKGFVLVAG